MAAQAAALGVPVMVVMFLLFPRIGPLWGLPQDAYSAMTGLSDSMAPGSLSQLTLSDAIAFRVEPLGALFALGAAFTWAIGTVLQKRWPLGLPMGTFTAWTMLVGGIPVVLGTLVFDQGTWHPVGTAAWLALAYNVVSLSPSPTGPGSRSPPPSR